MNIADELNIVYIKQVDGMDVVELPVSKFEYLLQKAYELGRKELAINKLCELGNVTPLPPEISPSLFPTGDMGLILNGNHSNQVAIGSKNVSLIEQG